jgi:hypothetical protein
MGDAGAANVARPQTAVIANAKAHAVTRFTGENVALDITPRT